MEKICEIPRQRNRTEQFLAKKMFLLIIILTSILCVNLVSGLTLWGSNSKILHYWAFDESSGNITEDLVAGTHNLTARSGQTVNKSGAVNRSFYFAGGPNDFANTSDDDDLDFGTGNFTITGWVNITTAVGQDVFIAAGSQVTDVRAWYITRDTGEEWRFGFYNDSGHTQVATTGNSWDVNTWYHWAVVREDAKIRFYWNGTNIENGTIGAATTINSGSTGIIVAAMYGNDVSDIADTTNGLFDEIGIWNRSLAASEISNLYNNNLTYGGGEEEEGGASIAITLSLPIDGDDFSAIGTNFSANYSSVSSNISNATYYLWNSTGLFNNSITVSLNGTTNSTSEYIDEFILGNYEWNVLACYANDTYSNCSWAEANFSFTVGADIDAEVYENISYETVEERFESNVTLVSGTTLYQSKLFYNGTSYLGTEISLGSDQYRMYRDIDIPLNTPLVTANNTFYWELVFEKADGSLVYQNLTFHNQTVYNISLSSCDAHHNVSYINFTTKEAVNPFPEENATFKSSWYYWLGSGTIKQNYTFENTTETTSNFSFCIHPVDKNYSVDTNIEFDADGYARNYHYLTNASIDNSSQVISLYLLNDSLATLTVLEVRDGAQNPLENVSIQIQLYDIGTGTYYTTAMAKTSFNGEDIAYLNWYDSFYKFILTKDGEVLKITEPYKISETPQVFEIITDITYPYDKYGDFVYTLVYNNATSNFILTFTRPSGLTYSGCLRVIKRSFRNDTTICSECTTSTSATLFCNIASYGNGTYYATFYATGSPPFGIDTISVIIGSINTLADLIDDVDGAIFAFLFVGITFVMFLISPVLGIIGLLAGMAGAMVLGFHIINTLALSSIVILGVFVIWLLGRK